MTTSATIVADSEWDGVRLTTILTTFPRFILPQFTRHRSFSFNTASSRAIPLAKRLKVSLVTVMGRPCFQIEVEQK